MVTIYGWGSTALRLEPLWGGSLLFTTKFSEIPGIYSFYRPSSHPVVLNTGPLDWESSDLTTRLLLHGKNDYQVKHHLLYNIKELVNLCNEEHKAELKYYQIREIISSEKHTDFQSETSKDDCRCETCENSELCLGGLKKHFFKQKQSKSYLTKYKQIP